METIYDYETKYLIKFCLNRTMQYGNSDGRVYMVLSDGRFKSYYVVWKPYEVTTANDGRYRLNRTMQYGNFMAFVYTFSPRACLNRTMQYGNILHPPPLLLLFHCLNRTMQYGNFDGRVYMVLSDERFKSYYVVWKLSSCFLVARAWDSLNRTMQYGNFARRIQQSFFVFV